MEKVLEKNLFVCVPVGEMTVVWLPVIEKSVSFSGQLSRCDIKKRGPCTATRPGDTVMTPGDCWEKGEKWPQVFYDLAAP